VILLLHNGVIHTLNPQQPRAQALAIRDGRILAVGALEAVRAAAAGEPIQDLDLRGRAVLPGLTDAHVHMTWHGLACQQVRLDTVTSRAEALERIAAHGLTLAPGAWLRGGGWDHVAWNDATWPTRADLDRVCPDRPAMLTRKDGHSIWANSRALHEAGISAATPNPPGGHIQRDAAGEPTGMLFEDAQDLVRRSAPAPTPEERRQALRAVMDEALSYGLTSVHIPPSPNADDAHQTLTDLHVLAVQGALSLRCLAHLAARDLDAAIALGLRSGVGNTWLRVGGLKIFSDGSLGSETAELLRPYEGRQHTGTAMLPAAELDALILKARQAGISAVVHAIGDAANRKVLHAIAQAHAALPPTAAAAPTLPDRIEHAQLVHPDDIPRFAALGVIAAMQPAHATSDMLMADALWGSRCAMAYALRSFWEAGVTLALSSDAPVDVLNPWRGIHAAITRQRLDGTPPGGWYPEQRISLDAALRGYCIGPAHASGEAALKGMLAPGMLADMAVVSADPFALPPEQVHTVVAEHTIVGGVVRWER
jgi:hypothetical protein